MSVLTWAGILHASVLVTFILFFILTLQVQNEVVLWPSSDVTSSEWSSAVLSSQVCSLYLLDEILMVDFYKCIHLRWWFFILCKLTIWTYKKRLWCFLSNVHSNVLILLKSSFYSYITIYCFYSTSFETSTCILLKAVFRFTPEFGNWPEKINPRPNSGIWPEFPKILGEIPEFFSVKYCMDLLRKDKLHVLIYFVNWIRCLGSFKSLFL